MKKIDDIFRAKWFRNLVLIANIAVFVWSVIWWLHFSHSGIDVLWNRIDFTDDISGFLTPIYLIYLVRKKDWYDSKKFIWAILLAFTNLVSAIGLIFLAVTGGLRPTQVNSSKPKQGKNTFASKWATKYFGLILLVWFLVHGLVRHLTRPGPDTFKDLDLWSKLLYLRIPFIILWLVLLAFCVYHLFRIAKISVDEKTLWIIVVNAGGFFGIVLYWFLVISNPQKRLVLFKRRL